MRTPMVCVALGLFCGTGAAEASAWPKLELRWDYQDARTGVWSRMQETLELPPVVRSNALVASDPGLESTVLLMRLADGVSSALKDFQAVGLAAGLCENPELRMRAEAKRASIGERLNEQVNALGLRFHGPAQAAEALTLMSRLAENMQQHSAITCVSRLPPWHEPVVIGRPDVLGGGAHAPLSVTPGGAQDYAHFKMVVEKGDVPAPSVFVPEGFVREFAPQLANVAPCSRLLCLNAAAGQEIHEGGDSLFVALQLGTNVTPDTFRRRPLNLAVVLDVSGSMMLDDGTEHPRLEWAKTALRKAIAHLNEGDLLSIVLFDESSRTLLAPQPVTDRAAILAVVDGIAAGGTTNLEAGLRDGFENALVSVDGGRENRVLLISDAGLNTGITDDAAILRLVTDHASDGIGLTAIGLGANFRSDLIRGITASRGGNYLFANDGKRMNEFYDDFDLLVSPVAYGFKARLDVPGYQLKRAFGVPADGGAHEVINVQTLFFAGKGGGNIVLEYVKSGS